ncbi:MAG TPA: DUF58 domain-containing protein [Anaerolineae bacterium]|nr:DUF58 domain-containing protein [Anaerolineae bacterium]
MKRKAGVEIARVRGSGVAGLFPLLLVLAGAALLTHSGLFVHLLYALPAAYLLARLWARHTLAAVSVTRKHETRVYLGEEIPVEIEVRNRAWLPVLWLHLDDTLPLALSPGRRFGRVLSLLPREVSRHGYSLWARRRGYYPFGPLIAEAGDLLGASTYHVRHELGGAVTVYPKIVPLRVSLPSLSPLGTLASPERLFEDPTRILGVRDYQPGDSLRRIDWKTSGRLGQLQVKRFEPAMDLQAMVLLNLAAADYPGVERYQSTELGIVIAASLVAHIASLGQAVGLGTNGRDPLEDERACAPDLASLSDLSGLSAGRAALGGPARKGSEHVMRLLEVLARVEAAPGEEALPFLDLLAGRVVEHGLPWGSTVVAITGREVDGLMEALLALRRRGLAVVLVLTCPDRGMADTVARATQIGAHAVRIASERELEAWL